MGHLELSSYGFALRSGVRVDGNDNSDGDDARKGYSACIVPQGAHLRRKGGLALLVEPAGEHPSLADEACRVAQATITQQYFADSSLSMTSSLLSALEAANRAVLEHDFGQRSGSGSDSGDGSIAVQTGGVRTKGAKVGVSSVLFRPDGSGVYLAQLAPTQAYLVHNGTVQALPEPPGWSDAEEVSAHEPMQGEDEGLTPVPASRAPLPAQSLGSQPGIVVDLIYRRVEAGDLIILVSPALARHIDRATAESIFLQGDAERVSQALYDIAESHSLARAHASVIAIGVKGASDSTLDLPEHNISASAESTSADGGNRVAPKGALGALRSRLPSLGVNTSRPKEWIAQRRASGDTELRHEPPEPVVLHVGNSQENGTDGEIGPAPSLDTSDEVEPEMQGTPQHPTSMLVPRPQLSLDSPPYKQPTLLFAETDAAEGEAEENLFDGWEDLPPALGAPRYPVLQRVAAGAENAPNRPEAHPYLQAVQQGAHAYTETRVYDIRRAAAPPPAHIEFGDDILDDVATARPMQQTAQAQEPAARPRMIRPTVSRPRLQVRVSREHLEKGKVALQKGASWSIYTLKSMLPERTVPTTFGGGSTSRRLVVPRKTVIALAVALLLGILMFSVFASAPAGSKQQATINYLQEAKQEDLLANQPGISDAKRRTHLTAALDKTQKALLADPESVEAKRLLAKVQVAIDKSDGVTRLKEPKLLFDLSKVAVQGAITTTSAVAPGGIALSSVIVQSDDAYLFEKNEGRIYRCKIAAQTCAAMLASGDSAGGEKVGKIIAMTMRVSSLVALDDRFVAYVFDADASAWQAQPLGDAANLQTPKDVATYDGNLYLVGAKPGQVSKYASGAYGGAPTDWIQDPASMEQMKDPVALGVDGSIYVLLGDGAMLVMQGGKVVKGISPAGNNSSPAIDLITGTDLSDIYLLRADGTITRVTKEGQTVATLKSDPSPDGVALTGLAVDEGRAKVYLLRGHLVYETVLPGQAALPPADGDAQQPPVKPTVEP